MSVFRSSRFVTFEPGLYAFWNECYGIRRPIEEKKFNDSVAKFRKTLLDERIVFHTCQVTPISKINMYITDYSSYWIAEHNKVHFGQLGRPMTAKNVNDIYQLMYSLPSVGLIVQTMQKS